MHQFPILVGLISRWSVPWRCFWNRICWRIGMTKNRIQFCCLISHFFALPPPLIDHFLSLSLSHFVHILSLFLLFVFIAHLANNYPHYPIYIIQSLVISWLLIAYQWYFVIKKFLSLPLFSMFILVNSKNIKNKNK